MLWPWYRCVWKKLRIELSETTILRYLTENGFSSRLMNVRTSGFLFTDLELAEMIIEWVKEARAGGWLKGLHCSIDFTFTGHRKDSLRTYSIRGAAQPQSGAQISRFTNCIVTCEWSDGVRRTPPMLFTRNREFHRGRKNTERRKKLLEHLDATLLKYSIDKSRVVVMSDKHGSKTFQAETAEIIDLFFKKYGQQKGAIFSDNGNAFLPEGASEMTKHGFREHYTYPAAVHQYLSPNDNKLHGVAKQAWRSSTADFSDDVDASLALLYHLDKVSSDVIKGWFHHNFLHDMANLKAGAVAGRLSAKPVARARYYKQCFDEYAELFRDGIPKETRPEAELKSELDGEYWAFSEVGQK